MLDEAGLDDFVAGKVSGAAKSGAAKAAAKVSPTKKARQARQDKRDKKFAKKDAILSAKDRINKLQQELRDKKNISPQRKKEIKVAIQRAKISLRKAQIGEESLNETVASSNDVIVALRAIVRKSQSQKIKLLNGKQIAVDLMTAGAVTSVYDALNPRNKVKFASTLAKDLAGFHKMSAFAIKNVSY